MIIVTVGVLKIVFNKSARRSRSEKNLLIRRTFDMIKKMVILNAFYYYLFFYQKLAVI